MRPEPGKILERAEQRFLDLPQATPEQTLERLRAFLSLETHRLRMLHRYGLSGVEVAAGRTHAVDALITHLYQLVLERYRKGSWWRSGGEPAAALVAVGGYGRGELCPYSDVDLLILYERSSMDFSKFLAKELIYLLWDAGLKVGHSWRTAQQCLEMTRADSTAENALLEARFLVGKHSVFESMRALLRKYWDANPRAFVERKRQEVEERYGKLGETVFLIEPDVKESPGGLRDFHTMLWLTRGAWGLEREEEWAQAGIISEKDRQRARRSYDWILRVRNEMHYLTSRRADSLSLAIQPEVAAGLKFRPARHQGASEVFMRQYFQHAEAVHQAMRLVLAAAVREKGKPPRKPVPLELLHGLPLVQSDSELRLDEGARGRFPESPLDMMRIFPIAQQLQLRLGEDLADAVRKNLPLVRRTWQRHPEMISSFLKVIRRPGEVAPALRAMHACGFLGKFLPEFGHITRLMQYDFYHRYTADEHTLRTIELLDEIWQGPPPSLERYRALTYHIPDPAPLYLALLLHDVGKGLGGGHSEKGAARAVAICDRLGLDAKRTAQVELLVREHFLLSHLSQRRDLSDRRVAQQAAEVTGDLETLSMLCLLTYADTAGVSPDNWTEWKNSLLWELFERVHGEFLGLEAATAQEKEKLSEMRLEVLKHLQGAAVPELGVERLAADTAREWMEEHLSLLPRRYLLGYRPDLAARQILLAKQVSQTGPSVAFLPVEQEGYTWMLLCCPDVRGLFAKVAGTLAALEVNILGARLETRKDGMAADVLWISTPRGDVISDPARLRRIKTTVEGVINGTVDFKALTSRIRPEPLGPVLKRPQLSLNNEISEHCTVLEVLAPDRLGLAYSLAGCFNRLGLNIAFAKLATEKTMAFDVFYLTDPSTGKLAEERWDDVLSAVEKVLQLPSPVAPGPQVGTPRR